MNADFFISVYKVIFHFRKVQNLKEKRKILESISQKLKNRGFTVTHLEYSSLKEGGLGFCLSSSSSAFLEKTHSEIGELFWGDFDIVSRFYKIYNLTETEWIESQFSQEHQWKYDEEG